MLAGLQFAVLVVICGAAAWSDARTRRIPNALTVPGLLAGLALGAAAGTPGSSALAVGAAFGLGFLLFVGGVLGGGDVKLLLAAAALLGIERLGAALALAGLAGGVLALTVAVRRGALLPVLLDSKDTLVSWVTPGRGSASGQARVGVGIPYGVAIAAGAIGAWFV